MLYANLMASLVAHISCKANDACNMMWGLSRERRKMGHPSGSEQSEACLYGFRLLSQPHNPVHASGEALAAELCQKDRNEGAQVVAQQMMGHAPT